MIRRLSSEDYTSCMTLLNDYPAENLFLISDIETFGFEEDFQQVWGEFNEQGQLKALMLNYEATLFLIALVSLTQKDLPIFSQNTQKQ